VDKAYLSHLGIVQEDKEKPDMPKICHICKVPNSPESNICNKCGKPLNLETALELDSEKQELEEKRKKVVSVLAKIAQKTGLSEEDIKIIKESNL